LRGLTLEIPSGAIVGLAGPNGAGKSTFLALATGLLAPTEGTISVLGRDPLRSAGVLAKGGYVAQGAPLYRSFSVAETIGLAGRELLQLLMDGVAETAATVVVASHVVADIERVCDHIVLLTADGVRLEGNVEQLLDSHRLLTGPRRPLGSIRGVREFIRERH